MARMTEEPAVFGMCKKHTRSFRVPSFQRRSCLRTDFEVAANRDVFPFMA